VFGAYIGFILYEFYILIDIVEFIKYNNNVFKITLSLIIIN